MFTTSNNPGSSNVVPNFGTFDLGDPIRVLIDGFNQLGFFIAFQNQTLFWGSIIDGQARLVITPINSILSIVKL